MEHSDTGQMNKSHYGRLLVMGGMYANKRLNAVLIVVSVVALVRAGFDEGPGAAAALPVHHQRATE